MRLRLAALVFLLALALPAPLSFAEPRRWFPVQLDLSLGYTGGRVPTGVLGLYLGGAGGGPVTRFGGLYLGVGGEGTLETLERANRQYGSLGLQLRAGWAFGGADDEGPAVFPRASVFVRATPMLTGVPLSAATRENRLALEEGTFPGLRLGLGVTAPAWSGLCFDSYAHPATPVVYSDGTTSSSGDSLLSCLWCFIDHAEIYAESYGRSDRVQTRWGFRVGGGF